MVAESGMARGPAASYGSGNYDPDMHDNKIVAMYETTAAAEAARDTLKDAGVPLRAIYIVDRSFDRRGDTDSEVGTGVWGAIKSLFMPDEDAHGFAEGVRRGHSMLVVDPTGLPDRQRIIELLENTDPVDFDAKLEEWRQAGYTYPGQTVTSVAGNADASFATGTSSYGHVPHVADPDGRRPETIPLAAGDIVRHPDQPAAPAQALPAPPRPAARVEIPRAPAADLRPDTDETLQVMEERLRVGKREVARGAVRIRSYIVERPVQQDVRLHEERVHLERRPVDRAADQSEIRAFQDRTIEVVARGEEAVVAKEARVVEEIAIVKDVSDRVETVRDTVRHTEVEVEDTTRDGPAGQPRR